MTQFKDKYGIYPCVEYSGEILTYLKAANGLLRH